MARMREGAEGEREVMGMEGDAYKLGRDFCGKRGGEVKVCKKSQSQESRKEKERYT